MPIRGFILKNIDTFLCKMAKLLIVRQKIKIETGPLINMPIEIKKIDYKAYLPVEIFDNPELIKEIFGHLYSIFI